MCKGMELLISVKLIRLHLSKFMFFLLPKRQATVVVLIALMTANMTPA